MMQRFDRIVATLLVAVGSGIAQAEAAAPQGDWILWYRQPATKWVEALPVGNGRLGGMVFGGVAEEQIQLNDDTLWGGHPIDRDRKGAFKFLPEARKLLFEGKYGEAQRIMQREFMGPRLIRSYQTLGDLRLKFDVPGEAGEYRRWLDLDTGVAAVSYRVGDVHFTREVLASAPDQVLAVRLTCDQPGGVTVDVTLDRAADAETTVVAPHLLVMRGQADRGKEHWGVKFEARLGAYASGGKLSAGDAGLRVQKADAVTLLLVAATDYRGDDPAKVCAGQLAAAAKKPYAEIRDAAVADHRRLFRRIDIQLEGPAGTSPAARAVAHR